MDFKSLNLKFYLANTTSSDAKLFTVLLVRPFYEGYPGKSQIMNPEKERETKIVKKKVDLETSTSAEVEKGANR